MSNVQRHDFDGCDEDIAKLYLKMAANQIKRIGAAMRSGSTTDISQRAHKLSGSSAFLGLKTMAKLLSTLEQTVSEDPSKGVSRLLGLIKEEFSQLQHQKLSGAPPVAKLQTLSSPPIPKRRFKIFIVDDHPLIQEGLVRLINLQPDFKICGQATTAHQALKAIPVLKPDVVIVDITLAGSDGIGLIKDMKLRSLKSLILVLSMHDESLYAERALRAGAKGYLMKLEAPKEVLAAIRRILAGEIYVSEKMAAKMLHRVAEGKTDEKNLPEGALSDRELQVFQMIGKGSGTRQIAEELSISPKTVESYRAHIKIKMNLKNAHELTQHAVHWVEGNHLN
jgi:DNA-binding NarL/FixJ family response regulator/HPt (histidine-containing phosphotransfer) domain-containing protein